jgi:methionyl-tRNA formyltransferase
VILDESRGSTLRHKLRKLRRTGPSAAPVGFFLRRATAAAGAAPPLEEFDVPVLRVPTLNGPDARAALAGADVALSLENALMTEATFAVPTHGTINVHHGGVPGYRGGPSVFWELADGRDTVGFTIHRIDAGIDTGPVLAQGSVPIRRARTLTETLAATIPPLHDASLDALEAVLAGDLEGRAHRNRGPLRTTPTLRDYLRVRRSLSTTSIGSP